MNKEPLGLPNGSVRALLALVTVGGTMVLGILACFGFEPPEYVWIAAASATTLALREYFGSREGVPPAPEDSTADDIAKDDA